MEIEYWTQLSKPREITAREAATLISEARHIIIVGAHDQAPSAVVRTFNALIRCYESFTSLMVVVPIFAPEVPPPNIRYIPSATAYYPLRGQRVFPELILGFLRDTVENRRIVDAITRSAGAHCSPSVADFEVHGPILLLDDGKPEIAHGAMLVVENLRRLCNGEADDLSLQ
jgi:hypothetical protein